MSSVAGSRVGSQGLGLEGKHAERARQVQLEQTRDEMFTNQWEGPIQVKKMKNTGNRNASRGYILRLRKGAMIFYDNKQSSNTAGSRPPILLQNVKSIFWSGARVCTPLETFDLLATNRKDTPDEDYEATHRCFHAMHEFMEVHKQLPKVISKFTLHSIGPTGRERMSIGRLGEGEVLYRPLKGHLAQDEDGDGVIDDEGVNKDVLRLSIALDLVNKMEATENLAFKGWVRKSSRRTNVAKERWLEVKGDTGDCLFFENKESARPRKTMLAETFVSFDVYQITIRMKDGHGEGIKLMADSDEPSHLGELQNMWTELERLYQGENMSPEELEQHMASNPATPRTGAGGGSVMGGGASVSMPGGDIAEYQQVRASRPPPPPPPPPVVCVQNFLARHRLFRSHAHSSTSSLQGIRDAQLAQQQGGGVVAGLAAGAGSAAGDAPGSVAGSYASVRISYSV